MLHDVELQTAVCHTCLYDMEHAIDKESQDASKEMESYRQLSAFSAQVDAQRALEQTQLSLRSAELDKEIEVLQQELDALSKDDEDLAQVLRDVSGLETVSKTRQELWLENNKLDRRRDALMTSIEADKNLETLYEESMDSLRHINPYLDVFSIETGMILFHSP